MTDGAKKLITAIVGFALLGSLIAFIWTFTNNALEKAKKSSTGILETVSVARFDGQVISGTEVNSLIDQTRTDGETAPVYVKTKGKDGSTDTWGCYKKGAATAISANTKPDGKDASGAACATSITSAVEKKSMDRLNSETNWYINPNKRFFVTVYYTGREGDIASIVIEEN